MSVETLPPEDASEIIRLVASTKTVAGRMEVIAELLRGPAIVDDSGEPTGEYGPPLITREQAVKLLGLPDLVVNVGSVNISE